MKKRFLAMLLSLVMAVGMLPVVSFTALAADKLPVPFSDDFQNYTVGTKFVPNSSEAVRITDNDGTVKWSLNKNSPLSTEIVSVIGTDGKSTNAMKVKLDTSVSSKQRLYVDYGNGVNTSTGIYVMEISIGATESSALYYNFGPLKRDLNVLYAGGVAFANAADYWDKIRFVIDASTDKMLIYHNGSLVTSYGETTSWSYSEDKFKDIFEITDTTVGRSIYIDDVKLYENPAVTSLVSKAPVGSEVSRSENPSVTFSNEILDAVINGDATVSSDCVEIVKTEDGSKVEVSSVELSLDGKTVTATPATELEYGKEYSVTFKNLTDVYGRDVAEVSYSFTTMEAPATSVTAPVFRKEALEETEGDVITELENGYISCEYSITNNSTTKTQNVLMIGVLWENDAIKSFLFTKKALGYNETASFYGGFNVTDAANSKIETYIWDGITTMVPLSKKGEFTVGGYTEQ